MIEINETRLINLINKTLLTTNIIVKKIKISKNNNLINIKADGVYKNSPSFIDLYIKVSNNIHIFINDIIINNTSLIFHKRFLMFLLFKNDKNRKYLTNNEYYHINIDKQLITLTYQNLCNLIDTFNIDNDISFMIKNNNIIDIDTSNNNLILIFNKN